jgi:hypothetical protein
LFAARRRRRFEIRPDERVVFFPTCGSQEATSGRWQVSVHGWIFKPEMRSTRRVATLGLLRRLMRVRRGDPAEVLFQERAGHFLVDNERGKRLRVRFGGSEHALEKSATNGHFRGEVMVEAEKAQRALEGRSDGWAGFEAVTVEGDARRFPGAAQLIEPNGWSVVSDIDDTVKESNVANRRQLIANTFLRPFEAVEGMPAVYRRWGAAGAKFHYVSASPWQLYEPLEQFFAEAGLPRGSFHLKTLQWRNRSLLAMGRRKQAAKLQAITGLLERFPKRRFVLVGDSGQLDPEVYGQIARRFPVQVAAIFIRNVSTGAGLSRRLGEAFTGVPRTSWRLYQEAAELEAWKMDEVAGRG